MKTEAGSSAGAFFGWGTAIFTVGFMLMALVKIGLVWFS